jgi:hypothetical protein
VTITWAEQPIRQRADRPRYSEADLRRLAAGCCNVGIILGAASGGLTDLDLDSLHAVRVARHFLPQNGAAFVQASNPASHRGRIKPKEKPAAAQDRAGQGLAYMHCSHRRASARTTKPCLHRLDFALVNRAALAALPALLARWCPGGCRQGAEWISRNPTRSDRHPGSFKMRLAGSRAGLWCDFATGDRGGDVISLAAYLFNLSQAEAARRIAAMLGISADAP